ncbi:hypothetical protein HDU67_007792 [Dinochytrium kinnereticum]|nr:hypothetical protein HDU67_007792 [Dinochytrium kinnereticum]
MNPRVSGTYGTIVELRACYDLLNEPRLLAQAKTNLAAYVSAAMDFHAPLPYIEKNGLVIKDEINKIANDDSIKSLNDLDKSIRSLQKKMGKADFGYFDKCLNVFSVYQPWALVAATSSNGQKPTVIIGDLSSKVDTGYGPAERFLLSFYSKVAPSVNLAKYKGYIVESINGKNPWDIAAEVGENDVTYAFTSPYVFNGTYLLYSGFVTASTQPLSSPYYTTDVVYKLKDPATSGSTEVTIPWAALSPEDAVVSEDFSYTFDEVLPSCLDDFTSLRHSPSRAHENRHPSKLVRRDEHRLTSRQLSPIFGPDPSLLAQMASIPKDMSLAFAIDATTAGLIFQTSFTYDPFFEDASGIFGDFFRTIDTSLAKVRAANPTIKKLVIDVSNSAWTCEHHVLFKYLFTADYKPLEYNIRLSDPVEKVLIESTKARSSRSDRFFSVARTKPVGGGSSTILETAITANVGSASTKFTGKFVKRDCEDMVATFLPLMTKVPKGTFAPENVMIVSDGLCSNGCDEFIKIAREQYKIKTVVYGKPQNAAPSFNSFARGSVRTSLRTAATIGAMNFTTSDVSEWSRNINIVVVPHNTFEPEAGIGATPLPLVEQKVADVLLKDMSGSGDWPMGIWKAAIAASSKTSSGATLKAGMTIIAPAFASILFFSML